MENQTYPLKIQLEPGQIKERKADRAKYKLTETSDWFFFQARSLCDDDTRVIEYFTNEFFSDQIDVPMGVRVKKHTPMGGWIIMQDYSLPDYNTEYSLEHDGLDIFFWEKAIVLDSFQDYIIPDKRVTIVRTSLPFIEENESDDDSVPALL